MRAVLFKGSRDLIPLYALYAVLFADHGLNTAQISSVLAIWSAAAFLLEVPSGAWADTVSRRALLILSGMLLVAGFALWTAAPSYLGFAVGFILWGASGALESGTFEALLYDELTARDEAFAYLRIMSYTRAAAETSALVAILAAAPLYAWGGYALIGWSSVAVAMLHTVLAGSLPSAPKTVSALAVADLADDTAIDGASAPEPKPFTRYLTMLRTGVGEAVQVRRVRNGVLLGALLYGITAYDEYFALLAQSTGASTAIVPLLVGLTVAGSLIGSLLSGRTERMSARTMAIALLASGVLFVGGALVAGLATHRLDAVYLLTGSGFTAIGAAYGIVFNAEVIAESRLQDAIEGSARATVTSVSGLLSEVVALAVFGFVALASTWLSVPTTVALLGTLMFALALATPAWLPPQAREPAVTP